MSAGYSRIGIHPRKDLPPGRYALDQTGRLHPVELSRFVKAVCIVTVRAKGRPSQTTREALDDLQVALERRQARKAVQPDFSRLAAAMKAKKARTKSEPAPTKYATSREPCELCGVPGFRGCGHQLPYEDQRSC